MSNQPPEKLDLTFLVICFNEEGGLRDTILEINKMLESVNCTANILILNDGSTDGTKAVADKLVKEFAWVEAFHHPKNVGQFYNLRKGLELARTTYYTTVPGDNQFLMSSYLAFIPFIGKYDVIFGFPNNEGVRGKKRVVLSYLWRIYLVILFNVTVVYLAGMKVAPVELMRRLASKRSGYLGSYETYVRMVLSGITYMQLPFGMRDRIGGKSKAVKPLRNILDVIKMLGIWWKIKGPGIFGPGSEYPKLKEEYKAFKAKLDEKSKSH